ncbi:ATP-binding protein [Bradyrhizobium sp. AZCC 2230]|uniref:ATP-binding protein n=1 Tax=Bradyrhizobium sp. AZCC 2230 TaxID=3117021 RepID=UPI002FF26A30
MNESIHGECAASELQDQLTELRGRVTGLIEQQTAISEVLRAGSGMRQVMEHRDPSSPTTMPGILRYGIAVLSVAIAIGLDFFLLRHFEAILTPFLLAVAATVWYAGTGPGVLAIVLSVLSLNYFFLRPFFSFSPISYTDLVYLTFCIFCALAVGWVSGARRRAEQELRQAREELEATVAERTASLQRSERYLAEAQRLTHCGVTAYKGSTIFFGSEEIYRIWGFDPAQGVPNRKTVLQRIHPDDRDRLDAEVARAVREKTRYSTAFRIVLPDGTVKHLESIGQPVFSTNGKLVEVVDTEIDVTERKRAEEAYREAQMALAHANRVATMGQLTASITHEVNQPITAAVTYALAARRFLSADPPNYGEVNDALSLIVKEGNRAGEVVERVRALVKKVPARKDAVAIDDAILEVIALTRAEAANNSVSVRTQFAEGLPRVQGDRVQLQQVMLNLIVNAIQAMRGIGEGARELQIGVNADPSEGGVRVGVQDTGPGLSSESLSRLFEPFYTTKPEGMGMGLSICRSIIEAHGGRLWAVPCEPQGALFQFTIPAT